MHEIRAKILVGADHHISGVVPDHVPPGEHEAIIAVPQPDQLRRDRNEETETSAEDDFMARIHAIQDDVASLPVLDPRTPDEILGYNDRGLFDCGD